jgi:hypothetical protein
VDAKKQTITRDQALGVLAGVDQLYAAKGKRVVHVDLRKGKPDRALLLGLLLGPTGNLRAPTLRKGRTLLVGFDGPTYAKVLG